MLLYRLLPDDKKWSGRYEIAATHRWGVPGVDCPLCGAIWSNTGLAYPSVDLSILGASAEKYLSKWPMSLDELDELRGPIIPLIPDASNPPPGTDLGPLVGTACGAFGDFAWVNPWTVLIRPHALLRLRAADVRMPITVPALLTFSEGDAVDLFELEIEPRARLAQVCLPYGTMTCRACGRYGGGIPEDVVIERSSIPRDLDLFRARDFATLILATEKFMEATIALNLTDILSQRVSVVDTRG